MNHDKSRKYMAFMMNAAANTETQMSGNVWLSYLTTCLWLLLWKISFSAYMVDYPLASKLLITSELSKDSRRFHMKDPCATCSGLIPMIALVGAWTPEVLDTLSARTLLSSSTTLTTWRWSPEPISSWWRYFLLHLGIHQHSQQKRLHYLLRSKLLLPLRKLGSHYGRWRKLEADLHPIRSCTKKGKLSP